MIWLPVLLKALAMGIVEGLTEFLPVSSIGHLILVGDMLSFDPEKGKVFEIVIQTGAILAIIWEYRARFAAALVKVLSRPAARSLVANVVVAFVPAATVGVLLGNHIKARLFKPIPVALAFIIGGLLILWAERRMHRVRIENVDEMAWTDALKIGWAQCLAFIPGTSRSGATIIGGLLFGLSRKAATEFSFYLAVPTLISAGAYEIFKEGALLSTADIGWFSAGSVAAFISALLCVRWLLHYVSSHDFSAFAWYRIAFGAVVIITAYSGLVRWTEKQTMVCQTKPTRKDRIIGP